MALLARLLVGGWLPQVMTSGRCRSTAEAASGRRRRLPMTWRPRSTRRSSPTSAGRRPARGLCRSSSGGCGAAGPSSQLHRLPRPLMAMVMVSVPVQKMKHVVVVVALPKRARTRGRRGRSPRTTTWSWRGPSNELRKSGLLRSSSSARCWPRSAMSALRATGCCLLWTLDLAAFVKKVPASLVHVRLVISCCA